VEGHIILYCIHTEKCGDPRIKDGRLSVKKLSVTKIWERKKRHFIFQFIFEKKLNDLALRIFVDNRSIEEFLKGIVQTI